MPQVSEKYLENRKKYIVKLALQVFAKKGYSNVSMKDIMDEVKISRGGLYAHFKNIDSIFIAVLMYDDSIQGRKILNPSLEKPLISQLTDWIYEMVFLAENKKANLVRAKSEFFLSHNVIKVPYLKERHEKLVQDIQHFLTIGIESGEFKKEIDVDSFCELLIIIIDGVMLSQYYQYASNMNKSKILSLINTMIKNTLIS